MNDYILEFDSVSYCYHTKEGETQAIKNISFNVKPGEFVGIVGPSGCGKSTILSLISSLLIPTEGTIRICGSNPDKNSCHVAYMLQHDHLLGWRTVINNCTIGLEIQHRLNNETKAFVRQMLERYGLGKFADSYPHSLSGGMRQRAALIRTLALQPQILLLDEPFSSLDYHTRLMVSDEISQIIRTENKTAVLVTHDISEAISMCDRVLVLSARPASITALHDITMDEKSPLKRRDLPEFRVYFNTIWKELITNAKYQ